jgi:hypothetical protein
VHISPKPIGGLAEFESGTGLRRPSHWSWAGTTLGTRGLCGCCATEKPPEGPFGITVSDIGEGVPSLALDSSWRTGNT